MAVAGLEAQLQGLRMQDENAADALGGVIACRVSPLAASAGAAAGNQLTGEGCCADGTAGRPCMAACCRPSPACQLSDLIMPLACWPARSKSCPAALRRPWTGSASRACTACCTPCTWTLPPWGVWSCSSCSSAAWPTGWRRPGSRCPLLPSQQQQPTVQRRSASLLCSLQRPRQSSRRPAQVRHPGWWQWAADARHGCAGRPSLVCRQQQLVTCCKSTRAGRGTASTSALAQLASSPAGWAAPDPAGVFRGLVRARHVPAGPGLCLQPSRGPLQRGELHPARQATRRAGPS